MMPPERCRRCGESSNDVLAPQWAALTSVLAALTSVRCRAAVSSSSPVRTIVSALAIFRSGELERRLGTAVGGAYVGIGGPHVGSVPSRGLVVVSRSDNRIGPDDIRRVLEAAGAI